MQQNRRAYLCRCIDFLIVFQRSYIAGAVKHNTLGLKMQSPVEIFTGSVSFGQLVIMGFMAILAFRQETKSSSIETAVKALEITVDKLSKRFDALEITVGELSRNAIRKFW